MGNKFDKTVSVAKGKVQALWLGVDIPEDISPGQYHGQITIRPSGSLKPARVAISLYISGQIIKDQGDSELWRHSRLRWLDSTLGLDDEVTKPYKPLEVSGSTVKCLGREVTIGKTGLPKSIVSKYDYILGEMNETGREILSGPVSLDIETKDGLEIFKSSRLKFTKQTPAAVQWQATSKSNNFQLLIEANMEYDGYITFRLVLEALRDITTENISMNIPFKPDVAKYMIGMGQKGGLRPENVEWKFDAAKHQDSVWIGDVNAGLQCKLKGPDYIRPLVNIYYKYKPLNLPDAWYNSDKGGVNLRQVSDQSVLLNAHSGPRYVRAGQQLHFYFDLLITPVKPADTKAHWQDKYYHNGGGATVPSWIASAKKGGANILNIHHGNDLNPYINYPFLPETTKDLSAYIDTVHKAGFKAKIYYTVRELTNHVVELWALRSLGDEVFLDGQGSSIRTIVNPNGADPWLRKHLGNGFVPAWRHPFGSGKYKGHVDASIVTSGMSRWHNYYVEGLQWLIQNLNIDGIYIDDVAYDRKVMQRVRKVFDRNRPGCLIDVHSWNHFNGQAGFANCANLYMEHFPYVDSIWFGEGFNYNESPDYWLVEISGIPYGVMSQMLQGGGNPWRGMIYGMTGRLPWSGNPTPVWKFWDDYDIHSTKMIGYWSPNCPVKTDHPKVMATVYHKPGRSIISIASWADTSVNCNLTIDWETLGLDRSKVSLYAPAIDNFQQQMSWQVGDSIPVNPEKGWLLVIDEKN